MGRGRNLNQAVGFSRGASTRGGVSNTYLLPDEGVLFKERSVKDGLRSLGIMGVLDRRAREHNATAILAFLDDPQVNSEDARSYIRARAEEVRTSTDRRHLESSYPKMVREAALEASERRRTQRSSLGLPTPEEEAVYEPVVR